jgi:predicted DNA-binding transcriptional regulator
MPDERMIPAWHPPAAASRESGEEREPPPAEQPADSLLVRPFLMTGGRTRPVHDGLRIETLVSAPPAALFAPLRFELRRIVELCQSPQSVAEIAVRLRIPLGVARVLVADLVTDGFVTYSQPTELPIELIERIRDRVRAL